MNFPRYMLCSISLGQRVQDPGFLSPVSRDLVNLDPFKSLCVCLGEP
jgi:hypothetical protein